MACVEGDLLDGDPGGEPQRDGGVAQVVDSQALKAGTLGGGQPEAAAEGGRAQDA